MATANSLSRAWVTMKSPPRYLVASVIVSIVGLLNGLDTGTIGPVTTMSSFTDTFGELSSTLHGLVVSSVLLTATIASLFAGQISDRFGRARAIAIGAALFCVGAALEAGAVNLGMFVGGRCVVGIGEGTFLSTLVVYICEISPSSKRGPLASTVQLLICAGIMIGYFICYGTVNIRSSLSWRLPLAIQSGIAAFGAIASQLYLPPSPRWLAHKGRKAEANAAWDRLGVSAAEREKEELNDQEINEVAEQPTVQAVALDTSFLKRLRQNIAQSTNLFNKDSRKQLFLGVFMMSMQQLSGIDGVLYYAPLLFQQAGISSAQATFLASGVSAILIFVSTIPAFLLSDRWGRRASTIYGGLVISGCMLLMGSLYASDAVHGTYGAGRWVVIVTIYIFALGYCMTWAVGVKLFASEIQPVTTRATATSLAQAANCITNFFVAFITPILLSKSSSAIYFLFGGTSILTVIVCTLFMPETRGQSLESISGAFEDHSISDMTIIRLLRKLGSRLGTSRQWKAGSSSPASSCESNETYELGGLSRRSAPASEYESVAFETSKIESYHEDL